MPVPQKSKLTQFLLRGALASAAPFEENACSPRRDA
jgi:hypothetical protein